MRLLGGATALAIVKAILGLVEVAGHNGLPIEGTATLTYYEPTANWLIMIALLGIFAALLARAKLPLWVLLCSPLLIGCLILSYRRSFWIGATLGILLVLLLGTSPSRPPPAPAGLLRGGGRDLAAGVDQLPVAAAARQRVASLAPSKLEANIQDRYRLDERANVLGRDPRTPDHGPRSHDPVGGGRAAALRGTRRRTPVRSFRGPVVLAEARGPRAVRLRGHLLGEHVARVAGVAAQPRAAAERLRPRVALRPGGPGGDRHDRELHRRGPALHGAAGVQLGLLALLARTAGDSSATARPPLGRVGRATPSPTR